MPKRRRGLFFGLMKALGATDRGVWTACGVHGGGAQLRGATGLGLVPLPG